MKFGGNSEVLHTMIGPSERLKSAVNLVLLYLGNESIVRFASPKPTYAEVRVTECCNSRCVTCGAWKNSMSGELTTFEIAKALKQLKKLGVKVIRLSGGEPLIRPDIATIIEESKNLGFQEIHVATNGLLLQKKAEELLLKGATRFDLSLDGIGAANDQIRGVPGHYSAVLRGVKEVKRVERKLGRKIPINIFTTLLKQNISQVPEIVELCEKIGARWAFSLLCGNLDFFQGVDVSRLTVTDWKAVDDTFDYLKRTYDAKPGLIYSSPNILEYSRNYIKGKVNLNDYPCILGYKTICLGSRGQIYPGCYVYKPVGNVREVEIGEIIKSSAYLNLIQRMYRRDCSGCTFYFEYSVMIRHLFQATERLREQIRSKRQ